MVILCRKGELRRRTWRMLAVVLAVVSCHVIYASGQSVSGELSADGKILTVNVAGGEVKSFDPSTLLADGSVVTNVVKTGAGRLDVPSGVDISSYMGGITVEGGTYRCENPNALGCWNSDDAGVFTVLEDAAVEFSPPEGLVFKSDKKRFSVSGRGPAGDGAVIYSPASEQTGGTALGSELYLAGDALLAVTTAVHVGIKNDAFKLVCNGHFLTIRPHVGCVFQYNYPSNPDPQGGGLILEDAVTQIRNSEAADNLGGGVDSGRVVITNGGTIQVVGSHGLLPWRLDVCESGSRILTGGKIQAGGIHTNVNVWSGSTHLPEGTVSVVLKNFDGNASAMTFKGPIHGAGGLYAYRESNAQKDKDSQFHLFSPENDFAGGLAVEDTVLYLWANGAMPADGGLLSVTDATVNLAAKDVFYELPGAVFSGTGYVSRAFGRWNSAVEKTGAGTLVYDALVDGPSLDVREGTVSFPKMSSRAKYAGVFEGATVYPDTGDASVAEAQAAYKTYSSVISNGWSLGAAAMYDRAYKNFWTDDVDLPEGVDGGDRVMVYSGYLWNDSPTNEVWTFAGSAGTWMYFSLNGSKIIDHSWKGTAIGLNAATVRPGANRFNLRVYSSALVAGPNTYSTVTNAKWTNNSFGFGYRRCKDVNCPSQSDFLPLMDPGDGSLLTYRLPDEAECPFPGTDQVVDPTSACGAFASVTCAWNTVLSFSGGGYSVSELTGLPQLTDCTNFVVRNSWTLSAEDVGSGRFIETDGRFTFGEGAVVSVEEDKLLGAGDYLVAKTGGVSGHPVMDGSSVRLWSVLVDETGCNIVLRRKERGLCIRLR